MVKGFHFIRLNRIERLLKENSKYGLTVEELASMISDEMDKVSTRTIYRDLEDIQSIIGIPLERKENGKWLIDKKYCLEPIPFTLPEAMTVFLAARLMLSHAHRYDPNVESAFYKLEKVVPDPLRKQIGNTMGWMSKLSYDKDIVKVLATLANAWVEQRTVSISYLKAGEKKPTVREIDTYFIQPASDGHSTYVIAKCHVANDLRLFKIERIKSAKITDKKYSVPSGFNANEYFASSWGVIAGGDAVNVKLRFHPRIAQIIGEVVWHPSQLVKQQKDGYLLMTLKVSLGPELMGWIMRWHEDVEVLGPKELRSQVIDAVKKMSGLYGSN